jgi:hypothetical protein
MGIASEDSPRSSSKFLIKMERSATSRSTVMSTLSDVVRVICLGVSVAILMDAVV